jgi:hypothetical protein
MHRVVNASGGSTDRLSSSHNHAALGERERERERERRGRHLLQAQPSASMAASYGKTVAMEREGGLLSGVVHSPVPDPSHLRKKEARCQVPDGIDMILNKIYRN